MGSVKTAISIEKPIFDQMDILAKDLKISRSRVFALAAEEFIQRHKNMQIFEALNKAHSDLSEPENIVPKMRSKHYKLVEDQW